MKLVERVLWVVCFTLLASCGGQDIEVPGVNLAGQATALPTKQVLVLEGEVELTYPAYVFSGQSYELSAKPLVAQSSFKAVRWLKNGTQNFVVANTQSLQGMHWTETLTELKYSGVYPSNIRSFKLEVERESGVRRSQQIDIPVYEHIQLGHALTVRADSIVDLSMRFDAQFEADISGPFETFEWQIESGKGAELLMSDRQNAQLKISSSNDIQKFVLTARAQTASGDVTQVSKKIVHAVPKDQWVAATHMHITDGLKVVLRADGSMVSLGADEAVKIARDIDPSQVKQLSGGFPYVVSVMNDGTARTLYPDEYVEDIPYDGLANIAQVYGSQSLHDYAGRYRADYLTSSGDWFYYNDVDQLSTLVAQGVKKLSSNSFRRLVLMQDGTLFKGENLVASNVKDASYSVYLSEDNNVVNVTTEIPDGFFSTDRTYRQVIGGNDRCPEATFAVDDQGVVSAFVPDALPFSAAFNNIQALEVSCEIGVGIDSEGSVILYEGNLHNTSTLLKSIFLGDVPSPLNMK